MSENTGLGYKTPPDGCQGPSNPSNVGCQPALPSPNTAAHLCLITENSQ